MKGKTVLLMLAVFVVFSCEKQSESAVSGPPVTGEIVNMAGSVTMGGQSVAEGDSVPDGSVIQTGVDGYCEIQFLGANVIRIFEDSIIRLSFAESTVSVDRGAVAGVLRNLGDFIRAMDDTFHINSGTVVAGIRGTSFYVRQESPDTSYFCLCNGKITLTDGKGNFTRELESTHHDSLRIRRNENAVEVSSPGMLYHGDEGMEALAASIGQR
ncbi:MAG: FecR family protein, partial [Spirochaetales bacterium]|nr:FecR family protein [Spirochaetales bacterium]